MIRNNFPKLDNHSLKVFNAVKNLSLKCNKLELYVEEDWPSTRDVANYCNFNIYKTRYILLKLVDCGLVHSGASRIRNALHWSISRSRRN